ncbi:putative amino acid permease [Tripterygium wilfordii]|uniref:Putative amino acid permease n=1 Tax=Tripterygium wilfordii TaxID=458696 RepID=A0A7J7D1Y3_TRIWF|nr:protein NRT1/ PTR FAMILY 5.8-like [Tripterygium wilfordii]KAF5740341.1 putative amino acid permease [Tripterygium wilfordii]
MAGGHRELNNSCTLLIVIAGMERFAFKGVASNLVTYLTDVVKMSNSAAAKTVNSWCGLTSIMPLLVVPFADSHCDRYSIILASSSLYVLGLVALTSTAFASAWSPASNISTSSFGFSALCLISLGQGGYNPFLQVFGAEQLETEEELPCTKDDQKPNKKSVFFQWWYFGVCAGSLLGVTVMSYIQDTFGWVLGFAMPTLAMVLSIVLFSYGTPIYRCNSDEEPMHNRSFRGLVHSIKEAASKLKHTKISLSNEKSATMELELQEKPLCDQNSCSMNGLEQNPQKCNYLFMNAKVVLRLLPIWTMLLMFAVIFQQPATFFTKQGMTMERNIGSFKIPPATLQSAITVSIILLMPLYEKVLIPTTRLITRNQKGISVMQRMGIGMFLSIIAMVIAAIVEMRRLDVSRKESKSETVPLSIFLLLPQYILLGVSDIFTVVGMQEFFYGEVPVKMRTMGLALYTSVFGVGSFLSALLISLVELFTSSRGKGGSWFSDDLSEARLDKYYWLMALLSALSLLFYVILCRFFESRSELENENLK